MLFCGLLLALCASVSRAILADWSLFPGDLFCSAPADTPVPRVGDATLCLLSFADESPAGGCQLDYSTAQMRFVVTTRKKKTKGKKKSLSLSHSLPSLTLHPSPFKSNKPL
jgi:hypothetical protein